MADTVEDIISNQAILEDIWAQVVEAQEEMAKIELILLEVHQVV